jgi:ABC-type antimicrobial peptide transport system permease subunit
VSSSGTLVERLAAASAPERFRALLVGSLAVLALVLAGLGLFAVSANAVAMRIREIGIRVALGASARRVRFSVMRDAVALALGGTCIGLFLAWMSSRGLRAFLADAPGFDLTVCGLVAAVFVLTSLVAALVPAWRASRVDPLTAMRADG